MAQQVYADGRDREDFCGLATLFEFTNDDGQKCRTNCGQAAAATILTHCGKVKGAELPALEVMCVLERDFPPDQFFGFFGTGRQQVERICMEHGLKLREIRGEEELKE